MAEAMEQDVAPYPLPRVTIKFCTQCKWMLRAAYFAQELLSTFSTSLGEVALQPSTGGTFVVEIFHQDKTAPSSEFSASGPAAIKTRVLWDRKTDGGFPETKELKRRVRDVIEPGRDLGHVDRQYASKPPAAGGNSTAQNEVVEVGKGEVLPSRSELEATGQAGGGYPGSEEAAAQLVSSLPGHEDDGKGKACGQKEVCEDCN